MPGEAKWRLVLEENFDQPVLNSKLWSYVQGGGGYGNEELQNYTDRTMNVRINEGKLIIEAHEEAYGSDPYTSGKIITKNQFSFQYGKVEIRARLPKGQGIWPAFWMMPEDEKLYRGWPSCGEIDIMEMIGHQPGTVYGTIHYGHPHTYTSGEYTLNNGAAFSEDFHLFSLEWSEREIAWYVDNQEYSRLNEWHSSPGGERLPFPAPFNAPFYLQVNLAVGGRWPGYPDDSTVFPQQLVVDYIKVYQSIPE
ncbi:family 16 glycosylhydrolase [Paenibacillus sp. NPDC057934]|uniref:glycoside hydrolase family 16 protein n=1 Tax=Paenibacillus sp. NPDC057934 TaxID=3346282 RepID=UPI0036DD3CE7